MGRRCEVIFVWQFLAHCMACSDGQDLAVQQPWVEPTHEVVAAELVNKTGGLKE